MMSKEHAFTFDRNNQYLQLILQCYFNGHAVAPLVVAGAFLITGLWLGVTSWGLRPLTM